MRQHRRRDRIFFAWRAAALATLLLAGGCASSADGEQSAESSTTTTTAPTTTTTSVAVDEPDEPDDPGPSELPVRMQVDWFVSILDDGGNVTTQEIEERFSPLFLAEVPADQIIGLLPEVLTFAEPPFTVDQFETFRAGAASSAILVGADGDALAVELSVAAAPLHLIEGRAAWEETMVVTDELLSTPNGEIYELATGEEVSLERLAEAMISISDVDPGLEVVGSTSR